MTAEQLEELKRLAKLPSDSPTATLLASLARKVIAAEKLVEALGGIERNLSYSAFYAIIAYREASK